MFEGTDELVGFLDGRGEIGVGKQDDAAMRLLDAVAHAKAFAAVDSVRNHAQRGELAAESLGNRGGAIGRAVVDNQDFHFPVAAVRVCGDLLKRCGEPQLFVVGRNDDGEFAVGGTHRSGGFCQEWCPTRGTKRQPSSVFVENAPACFSMRSEEHTSELQSRLHLVCRLLLEKKKNKISTTTHP